MQRGRKPKPSALHIVDGSVDKMERLDKARMQAAPQDRVPVSTYPEWFTADHVRVWNRVRASIDEGVLLESDADALATYVGLIVQIDRNKFAEAALLVEPEGEELEARDKRLLALERNQAAFLRLATLIRPWAGELGLTPTARSRIVVDKAKGSKDDLDAFLREHGAA